MCQNEQPNNTVDRFAVAVVKTHVAGHVPLEISRVLFYAIEHGCSMVAYVEDTLPHNSPLTQGGLEIKATLICTWTEDRLNILRGLVTGRYNFDDSFTTDDFNELLREVREGLILGETFDIDTEDEIEQDDEMLAISVIDDVDEDEENV